MTKESTGSPVLPELVQKKCKACCGLGKFAAGLCGFCGGKGHLWVPAGKYIPQPKEAWKVIQRQSKGRGKGPSDRNE